MVRSWRIQVPSFGQPGRTDRHPEDAGSLLVVASSPSVRVGQFGAHDEIAPADLLRSLGVDGFGLDQAMGRFRLAQNLRPRIRAQSTLPALRVEPVKGCQEGVAANVGAEPLDVPVAGQALEGGRDYPEAASRRGHRNAQLLVLGKSATSTDKCAPSAASDTTICLVRRDKLNTFGDARVQLFIGHAATASDGGPSSLSRVGFGRRRRFPSADATRLLDRLGGVRRFRRIGNGNAGRRGPRFGGAIAIRALGWSWRKPTGVPLSCNLNAAVRNIRSVIALRRAPASLVSGRDA